jgi:ATP-dependent Clp protease ATP-binding subunit ClpA
VAALDLGHNFIGTEHILLGLLRVPESRAAQLLRDAGIDHDRAREAIKAALVGFQHRGKR